MAYASASSAFAGISTPQLEANLATAQQALFEIMSGAKAVDVTYEMGEGKRRVVYTPTDAATVRDLISELRVALGQDSGRRRAIGVAFR